MDKTSLDQSTPAKSNTEKGVRGFKSMIVIREVVGFDPARAVLAR